MASKQQETERTLQREVARLVARALPGVDVLALELTGKERFTVYNRAPPLSRHIHRRGLLAGIRTTASHT